MCRALEIDSALEELNQLDKELEETLTTAKEGRLVPLPGETVSFWKIFSLFYFVFRWFFTMLISVCLVDWDPQNTFSLFNADWWQVLAMFHNFILCFVLKSFYIHTFSSNKKPTAVYLIQLVISPVILNNFNFLRYYYICPIIFVTFSVLNIYVSVTIIMGQLL